MRRWPPLANGILGCRPRIVRRCVKVRTTLVGLTIARNHCDIVPALMSGRFFRIDTQSKSPGRIDVDDAVVEPIA